MIKAGILGGGQLGRMLLQAAANYPVETYVMENDPNCPAAHLCQHFVCGDIRNESDVYAFGRNLDVISIEIEQVNVGALERLEAEGVRVVPSPAALKIIRNKIFQKEFYQSNDIPSSPYIITQNLGELRQQADFLPAVHKLATGGYDGRGVQLIPKQEDIEKGFDAPAVLEKMVKVDKEISVIIAVDEKGQTAVYPPVDMVFDPQLNQLSHQLSPADLPEKVFWKADAIALNAVRKLKSPGLFAVELFSDDKGQVFVNEIAPRVHNSGHHSIEASYCSQFDMFWRILLQYPFGNTAHRMPSALLNIVGAPGYSGEAVYRGLEEVLAMDNVFVHIYGKKETRPGRKMGHVCILSPEKQELLHKINKIKHLFVVEGKEKI